MNEDIIYQDFEYDYYQNENLIAVNTKIFDNYFCNYKSSAQL